MTSDEETGPQSHVRDLEVVPIERRDNVVEPNNDDKKAKKPRRSKSTDLSKLDYSQAPQRAENICVNRHKAINAVNTYETKVNGARIKFEEVSRSVRGLQYYTYHGSKDMASVDLFLCVYDGVPISVPDSSETKQRENGPKFFIQARPNYPVRELSKLFTTMGNEMAKGKTRGANWEFCTSGSELLGGLFGEEEADRLMRDAVTGGKSARIPVPVYGPGYHDRADKKKKFVKVVQHNPTNQGWKKKFRSWGPHFQNNVASRTRSNKVNADTGSPADVDI